MKCKSLLLVLMFTLTSLLRAQQESAPHPRIVT
jgi:hypothetical protein